MSILCDSRSVGMEDAVNVETLVLPRFLHLDQGLNMNVEGRHNGMYCKRCDIRHRKVKKDMETPRKQAGLAR